MWGRASTTGISRTAQARGTGRRRFPLRRAAALSAASAIGLGGVLVAGVTPSASAFDCQHAPRCPYLKIENRDKHNVKFEAWAYIYKTDDPGNHLYDWHERKEEYTLWHWRHYGGDYRINIKVNSWGYDTDYTQTWDISANDSVCLAVDRAGPYLSAGCQDSEDPAKNIG